MEKNTGCNIARRSLVILAAAAAFSPSVMARIRIKGEKEYDYTALNEEIKLPNDPITMEEILDRIQEVTGYRVVVDTEELRLKKRFVDMGDFHTVGAVLDDILSGEDAIYDVNEKKRVIRITYPEEAFVDFPRGWNIVETRDAFRRMFPKVSYDISGNRLYVYGTKEKVAEVARVLKRYVKDAYGVYDVTVEVFPYCTDQTDQVFIAKRKYYGSERFGAVEKTYTQVRHDDRIVVTAAGRNVVLRFDSQHRRIYYGDVGIPFEKLSTIGIAVSSVPSEFRRRKKFSDSEIPGAEVFDSIAEAVDRYTSKANGCSHVIITAKVSPSPVTNPLGG